MMKKKYIVSIVVVKLIQIQNFVKIVVVNNNI